jgi:deoxyguanosine kinase
MIAEAYDTNPYMPQVYAGRKDLALDSQLYFLNSRAEQLDKNKLTPGAVAVGDYVFDKEMIYATRTLSSEQLAAYMPAHDAVAGSVAECVLAVYLHDSPGACLKRIDSRNRPYEKQIDLDTLHAFAQDYDRLFARWRQSPVIRLDASRFNCTDVAQVRILADEVRQYIWKSPEK